MHELLAPLLYAIDFDSLDPASASSSLDPELVELCDPTWIAADAHALFSIVMGHVGTWYEWQEPPAAPVPADGQVEIKPFIAPIVTICNTIHGEYLQKSDPALWAKLKESQIEPQIYGM